MKLLGVFVFCVILVSVYDLSCQTRESWQGITPLKSTRAELETVVGSPVAEDPLRYKTKEGDLISVVVSNAQCDSNGWQVPKNVILEYSVTLRKARSIGEVATILVEPPIINHSGQTVMTNYELGIQVSGDSPSQLDVFRYFPNEKDASSRCEGFPPFDPYRELYYPSDRFPFDGSDNNVARVLSGYGSSLRSPENQLLVHVYQRNGRKLSEVTDFFEALKKELLGLNVLQGKINLVVAGFRKESEIELFIIQNTGLQAPKPLPSFPCHEKACYESYWRR